MSRRYAEFACSISALDIDFEEYRTGFDNYQLVLKSHIEQLLSKFSHTLGSKKLQNVFFINNYDLIVSIFEV